MGKLKDMERAQDLAPLNRECAACNAEQYEPCRECCLSRTNARCANCEDTLEGYFSGTVYCDPCADSV